jgi:hypothetical protein
VADTFVLFVDMLGFAGIVEAAPNAGEIIKPSFGPFERTAILTVGNAGPAPEELLAHSFGAFHSTLEDAIRRSVAQGITAIVFSDSAFIQLDSAYGVTGLAGDLMRSFVYQHVPVRMGLAAGSFTALRFSADNTNKARVQTSQFFGTGVVWSYNAEKCGEKGLRILLHPSIVPHVEAIEEGEWATRHVPLGAPTANALSELNYANPHFMSDTETFVTEFAELAAAVQSMRQKAPDKFSIHYEETLTALARMDEQWTGK